MRKTLRKILLVAFIFALFSILFCFSASAETQGDYEYTVLENGTIEISGYNGSASVLTIPSEIDYKQVTSIGYYAFGFCESLTSVTIPNSITNIGYYAFESCENLTSVTIPNSATSIGDAAFDCCTSLTSINIPDSVTSIGERAFNYCINLKTAKIGKGVTCLPDRLFGDCENLTSVIIPEGVLSIGVRAFRGCSKLNKVYIPKSVNDIDEYAFGYLYGNEGWAEMLTIKYSPFKIFAPANSAGIKYATDNGFDYEIHNEHTFAVLSKATLTKNGAIKSECSVCGYADSTTTSVIYSPKTITLSSSSVTYNGKTRSPSVTVKDSQGKTLKNGTDYTVTTPSGRKMPGEYTYKITFKGNYEGEKILKFTILPKAPDVKDISATQSTSVISLKWKASAGATGYRVYQYSSSKKAYVQIASVKTTSYKKSTNLKAGTEYKFKVKPYTKLSDGTVLFGTASEAFTTATECKAPKITSVTSPSKAKATVKWSNVDGETGYQLYYSTKKDSGFKKVDSYSANKLTGSKTFSASASGKTIYFKVRAYKKVSGQTIYSEWSAVKSVKLK